MKDPNHYTQARRKAKKAIKDLLEDPRYTFRKMNTLKERFRFLSAEELRLILTSLKASSSINEHGEEIWGLISRTQSEAVNNFSNSKNNFFSTAFSGVPLRYRIYATLLLIFIPTSYFGYTHIEPEISIPFAKISLNSARVINSTKTTAVPPTDASKKMDISVFELSSKTNYNSPTLNIQKKWEGYRGLSVMNEYAKLLNSGNLGNGSIWADLEGIEDFNGKTGKVTCIFGEEWTQRIELLGEKERDERLLTFSGTVRGDLSQGQLPIIEDCKLQ